MVANSIGSMVTATEVIKWIVIAIFVGYFLYKEIPDIIKKIENHTSKKISEKEEIKELQQKVNVNTASINAQKEELEIMMRAMLGVLKGLQELGTNGPTKEAEKEIENYLNKKAHGGI